MYDAGDAARSLPGSRDEPGDDEPEGDAHDGEKREQADEVPDQFGRIHTRPVLGGSSNRFGRRCLPLWGLIP